MKILHISTYPSGGATKAGYRLHKGLLKNGIDSSFLFLHGNTNRDKNEFGYMDEASPSSIQRVGLRIKERIVFQKHAKHLVGRPKHFEMFSEAGSPYRIHNLEIVKQADIIVLHWVNSFLDYLSFFGNIDKPVVWVLHDMNPFTGGCHYAGSCDKFTASCQVCPQLSGTIDPQYSAKIFAAKLKALKGFNKLSIITLSQWMQENSQKSMLLGSRPHYHIPNSLDATVFSPKSKQHCREMLGLPADKKIILFVADNVHNHRKGYAILVDAIKGLTNKEQVLLVQIGNESARETWEDCAVKRLGVIQDELLMSMVYAAADVFVIPSLEDNLPNTVMESLMTGTPVIGFALGGIKDMVEDGQNGYLVTEINAEALSKAMERFLLSAEVFDKDIIRKKAFEKYNQDVQANQYIALFKQLV
jgi:glycosyltransferase involved in cell wall biosynthesis